MTNGILQYLVNRKHGKDFRLSQHNTNTLCYVIYSLIKMTDATIATLNVGKQAIYSNLDLVIEPDILVHYHKIEWILFQDMSKRERPILRGFSTANKVSVGCF